MTRPILIAVWTLGLAALGESYDSRVGAAFAVVRPDFDLVMGFERCAAPADLYGRLQDEILFAAGVEALSPGVAALAGIEQGRGVEGLVVAVRGTALLAVVPVKKASDLPSEPGEAADTARQVLKLNERLVAYGDLTLLRDERSGSPRAATPQPPLIGESPSNRCAWVVARPAWVRGDAATAIAAADVRGRSVLRALDGLRSLTLTADLSSGVEVTLRATAADPEAAAVLEDALYEFLVTRRGNRDSPEAVRMAVEQGTVRRQSETVTLRLPLSETALNRIRRNPDSRSLLRLRLEAAERERWQRVADIARALDLRENSRVADIGAGEGFFSVRLARAVGPGGRVFAVEIGEKDVAALSRRAEAGSLRNVHAVLGAADDPHLPRGSLDAALIVNAYHEMTSYGAMLARVFESLKPGGRLVLVEPWSTRRRDESRADQVKDHLIAPELAEQELRHAGFEIAARRDDFISGERRSQWLIQASRPAVVQGSPP